MLNNTRSACWLLVGLSLLSFLPYVYGNDTKQVLFERVFGSAARLDPDTVAKVKAMAPGQRFYIDNNNDGKNDECWFIDNSLRHTEEVRPLLVRVIDEDGDMDLAGPDLDSDLYIADWKADGKVDVIKDYKDVDGDNDLDEIGLYTYRSHLWGFDDTKSGLTVWWSRDIGDDNLLWYDVNYGYSQSLGQFRCNFSGDEMFIKFVLMEDSENWIAYWEAPFIFFDSDKDGSSEIVLRFVGVDENLKQLRYSMDADGDAYGKREHDYEFSITALSDSVQLENTNSESYAIREIPTGRFLRVDKSKELAKNASWEKVCLTWDEINCNTQENVKKEPHERWEGIINHASKSESFPQIGGPPCSAVNKRVEVSLKPVSPLQLYYASSDHRLHLLGASEGYLDVDYDLDGKVDMIYTYLDINEDGIFEKRQIDIDADGKPEFTWAMDGVVKKFDLEYKPISSFYQKELAVVLKQSQKFIDTAKSILGENISLKAKDMEAFFLTKLKDYYPTEELGPRIRNTPAGARYYTDIIRDQLFHDIKQQFSKNKTWTNIEKLYASGKYADAANLIYKLSGSQKSIEIKQFENFTHRIPVCIVNPTSQLRENWPVILNVQELKVVAKNFNPENCAVVTPNRWVDWLEIPHQLDEIDSETGQEISFLAGIPAGKNVWYLYYSPTGTRSKNYPKKTGTEEDWAEMGVNIGWESNVGAYRAYTGYFDFFGKKTYHNGLRKELYVFPVRKTTTGSYHNEQVWGIDALHVGETPGIGGLTLYEKDKFYPVYGPKVSFTKKQTAAGSVRAAVKITAKNIIPDKPNVEVKLTCIIYAQHQESEIQAKIINGSKDMALAPGLVKLLYEDVYINESNGIVGTWGHQDEKYHIGDIGMGIIVGANNLKKVINLEHQRNLLCKNSDGSLQYWIIGDWQQGRRFPIAPTIENWKKELNHLSDLLLNDVKVSLGCVEKIAQKPAPSKTVDQSLKAGQESQGPWWMQQTAMDEEGKISISQQKWFNKAAGLSLGESFIVEAKGEAKNRMLVRKEKFRIRYGKEVEAIVWVIDDDADGSVGDGGDKDSDCYVVDYDCDGIIDRIVDYIDNDNDNDPDEMDIRYFLEGRLNFSWFGVDIDDDSIMWSLTGYEYDGNYFASDPYGDNIFYMNKFNPDDGVWSPISECPFAFYDTDSDGYSEVVIRASAVPLGYDVKARPDYANSSFRLPWSSEMEDAGIVCIRYSFDIDKGSCEQTPIHYEMGFNLSGATPYQFGGMERYNAKRRPPQQTRVIPWNKFRNIADNFPAEQTGFSWHEQFDDTVAIGYGEHKNDDHRWEGVCWTWRRRLMANTGGPTPRWNVRREWTDKPTNKRQLYFSEVDKRIHLLGAKEGWIKVGNFNGLKALGEIRMFDTDNNGYFDRWEFYDTNNPEPVRVSTVRNERAELIEFDADKLSNFYTKEVLPKAMIANKRLMDAMSHLRSFCIPQELKNAMVTGSDNFRRYAQDIARELQYQDLRKQLIDKANQGLSKSDQSKERLNNSSYGAWRLLRNVIDLDTAYGEGDYDKACIILNKILEKSCDYE